MTTTSFLLRASLLASIAFTGFAGAAHAQTAAADAVADDTMIIVTASQCSATLQDTPISVSVTSREQLDQAQIRDLRDLQTLVPSLRVNQLQNSANTNFIIRGFGNVANHAGVEPSVGVFIDGVYRSRPPAQIGDLPNLERIEVLRGPQSTLFGKNASAGIISIVTSEPQFTFGGNAEASYGNFNATILKGGVTGPISEKIAVSLDGNFNKRDGYGFDVGLNERVNDRNRWGVRGSILFKASEDFKIRLIADYDKIDENCCLTANFVDGPTGAIVRAVGGRIISNQPFAFTAASNIPSSNNIENYGISGQADWNLSDTLALTSITAYRRVMSDTNQDLDFTSADLIGNNANVTNIKTFTQEVRLASSFDGPLNFLIGGFYFNEKIDVDSNLRFGRDFRGYANALTRGAYSGLEPTLRALLPGTPAGAFGSQGQGVFENYDYSNQAYSVFGQVDFKPVEGLTLTAGGNYTNDRKQVATNIVSTDVFSGLDLVRAGVNAGVPASLATNPAVNPFLGLRGLQILPPFVNFPNSVEDGRTNDSKFTYKLRAAYKLNDNFGTYATYATGFKASSFGLLRDSRTGTRTADPENAEVYELGLKGQFDGFAFNLAIFKQALNGFQGNIFNAGSGFVLGNGGRQSTTGVELDAKISPIKNLTFTTNFTYLNPKFDSFIGGAALRPGTFAAIPTDLSGVRPAGIPEFSYSIAANYAVKLNETMRAVFHIDYFRSSPVLIAQGLNFKRKEQSLNASITLAVGRRVELTVWGRNLADSQFITALFPGVAQAGSLQGYPSQPRTFGALVRYRFS